ncbi:hypothetical protein JDW15_04230 [Aerococcaceae bacterium zg-ZJ1578]|uniref:hypothetical protein n=1 Tax=Aerococcaceae bacterium zg-252 TaxID=2796928 RepID=UPI001A2F0A3B|nr:hypothetical protein [Aerococcaceae bacterium zg-1578]
MKPEVIKVLNEFNERIKLKMEPKAESFWFTGIAETSNEIISILEKKEMTYAEAYATLIFTYESLKYKSEKVNL